MYWHGKKVTLRKIIKFLDWKVIDNIFKSLFNFWQRLGFHITRNHFYEPIPDTRKLASHTWGNTSDMLGINMNDNRQLELLNNFKDRFKIEFDLIPLNINNENEYYVNNGSFTAVDGEILYCMIRFLKPKHIYEIGSGNSTLLIIQAVEKNKQETGVDCEIISIDPYHDERVKKIKKENLKLIIKKVEELDINEFSKLEENDILFIDSSHVLKIGSDVQYEYLDLLPRLNKGVVVHIHDIFLPAEYPKEWVLKEHRFWNEQYLLQAFLAFNDSFEILMANSFLHLKYSDKLEEIFNSYKGKKAWPGSFWMKKIK
jgi:predicted O-methyltransferase YrrM